MDPREPASLEATQRALQEALARIDELEARFDGLAYAAFEATAVHENGRILMCNEAFATLFGYPREALVGMPLLQLAAPESREIVARMIMAGSEEAYQAVGLRSDGSRVLGQLRSREVPYQGRTVRVTAVRDETADREAADEIARRTAELERIREIDRLKNHFVSTVSHELRTPLTSIKGYTEFLEDDIAGPLSPQQREFVEQIHRHTERLQELVDDLLDFARQEAGTLKLRPARFDLAGKLRDVAAGFLPQVRKARHELALDIPEGPVWVEADARRIEQVVVNLLTNANKFTPAGGTLTVRLVPAEAEVRVEVQDTGVGVSPEHQARLFDKFYQVDPTNTRAHGGAGLGLTISKALVEGHGGQIGVVSAPGGGSTFWFTLPRQGPPHAPARS